MTAATEEERDIEELMAQLQVNIDEYNRIADEDALRTDIPRPTLEQMDEMKRDVLGPLFDEMKRNVLGPLLEIMANDHYRVDVLERPADHTRTELQAHLAIQQGMDCEIVCPIHGNVCECETDLQLLQPTREQMEQRVVSELFTCRNFIEFGTPIDGTRTELEDWAEILLNEMDCAIVCPNHVGACECGIGLQLIRIPN